MTEQICENVDTTVDAPICPECRGACVVSPMGFARRCDACDGTGYERGDTASLLQMVQAMAAAEDEAGRPLTCSEYQQIDARYRPGIDLIGVKLAEEAGVVG